MTSSLSGIAVGKRRQLAATLGLFAVLFVAVGAVAATDLVSVAMKAFVAVAIAVAVVLALMAWGVVHSIRADIAEQTLDSVIEAAVKAHGGQLCDCGHEHDPTELHFVGDDAEPQASPAEVCAHDGAGADCAHSCDTCVLAALRPAPGATAASNASNTRPAPAPRRPSPSRR